MKKTLSQQVQDLQKEVESLRDENESLWFILEEMDKSSLTNPEYKEKFDEVFKKARFNSLMAVRKVTEA
jgi:regulator of replication initiation timing